MDVILDIPSKQEIQLWRQGYTEETKQREEYFDIFELRLIGWDIPTHREPVSRSPFSPWRLLSSKDQIKTYHRFSYVPSVCGLEWTRTFLPFLLLLITMSCYALHHGLLSIGDTSKKHSNMTWLSSLRWVLLLHMSVEIVDVCKPLPSSFLLCEISNKKNVKMTREKKKG